MDARGPYFQLQSLLPLLGDPSSVGFTSSIAGSVALAGASIYSATKPAVISLGKTLAVELAPRGVRVNVLSPGPIDTPIIKKVGLPADQQKAFEETIVAKSLLKRFGVQRSGPGSKVPAVGRFEQHSRHGVDHRRRRLTELTAPELISSIRSARRPMRHPRCQTTNRKTLVMGGNRKMLSRSLASDRARWITVAAISVDGGSKLRTQEMTMKSHDHQSYSRLSRLVQLPHHRATHQGQRTGR